MSTLLRRLSSWILLTATLHGAPANEASSSGAPPFNQLSVSGNACGPAALLNSFRYGDKSWQRALDATGGPTDKQRLTYTLRTYGQRPSGQLAGRTRWSKAGINVMDLTAIANDLGAGRFLPKLKAEIIQMQPGESPVRFLGRTHSLFSSSFRKGLPPVIAVRRMALRKTGEGRPAWITLESHFITLTRIPEKLGRGETAMAISYIDPWGGRRCSGTVRVANSPFGLEVDLPATPVGKKLIRSGETTTVTLSAAIGHW